MMHHYTDRSNGQSILREGRIRADHVYVMTELFGGDRVNLEKAVWLTTRELMSPVVAYRMVTLGLSTIGSVRIRVHDNADTVGLKGFADRHGHDYSKFNFMVATAAIVGESWKEWRLVERDIPKVEWVSVEFWNGKEWDKVPESLWGTNCVWNGERFIASE